MRSSSVIENQVEKIAAILRAIDHEIKNLERNLPAVDNIKENLPAIDQEKEKNEDKEKKEKDSLKDSIYLRVLKEVYAVLKVSQNNNMGINARLMTNIVDHVFDLLNTFEGVFTENKINYQAFLRSIYFALALVMDKDLVPVQASLTTLINNQFEACMQQSLKSASSLKFKMFGKATPLLDELKNILLTVDIHGQRREQRDFSVMGIEDMGNMLATLEKIATQDAKGEYELKKMIKAKNRITLGEIHADPVLSERAVTVPTGMYKDKDHKVQIKNKLNPKDTAVVNFVLFMHQQLAAAYQRSLKIAHGLSKPVSEIIYTPDMIQCSDKLHAISTKSKLSKLEDNSDVAFDAKRKGFILNGNAITLSEESKNDNDQLEKEVKKAIEEFTNDGAGAADDEGSKANKLFYFGGQWLQAEMGSEFAAQIAIAFPDVDISTTKVNMAQTTGSISDWTINSNQEIIGKISYKILSISVGPADKDDLETRFIPTVVLGADGQSLMELDHDNPQHSGMVERLSAGGNQTPHSVAPVAEIQLSVKLTEDPQTKEFFIEPTGFDIKLNTTHLLSRKDLMLMNEISQAPSSQPNSPKIK